MDPVQALLPVAPPRADLVILSKYIVIVLSLIFVPYISILFGSVVFSLATSTKGLFEKKPQLMRLSKDIIDMLGGNLAMGLVLGILPVFTMMICFAQLMYGSVVAADMERYFLITLLLVAAGIASAYLFRKSFATRELSILKHSALGLGSAGVLTLAIFAFVSTVTLLLWPEKWERIQSLLPLTYDWNMIARFKLFLVAALGLTGGAIMFFFFRWMGGKEDMDDEYRTLVHNFGAGTALGFSILSALMFMWFLATLPYMAKSFNVYWWGICTLFVLMLAVLRIYGVLSTRNVSTTTSIFVMLLGTFLLTFITESAARDNSLAYQFYHLEDVNAQIVQDYASARSETSRGIEASVEIGEQIYNQKCVACHQFDKKVIGPPYLETIPRYNGDLQKLKAFILNPAKINPDYPAMPNQGVTPPEAESAAMYLLQQYEARTSENK